VATESFEIACSSSAGSERASYPGAAAITSAVSRRGMWPDNSDSGVVFHTSSTAKTWEVHSVILPRTGSCGVVESPPTTVTVYRPGIRLEILGVLTPPCSKEDMSCSFRIARFAVCSPSDYARGSFLQGSVRRDTKPHEFELVLFNRLLLSRLVPPAFPGARPIGRFGGVASSGVFHHVFSARLCSATIVNAVRERASRSFSTDTRRLAVCSKCSNGAQNRCSK